MSSVHLWTNPLRKPGKTRSSAAKPQKRTGWQATTSHVFDSKMYFDTKYLIPNCQRILKRKVQERVCNWLQVQWYLDLTGSLFGEVLALPLWWGLSSRPVGVMV